MKIVGIENCKNLRKYVDDIVMKNLPKGQNKFYYNTFKEYFYLVIKRKLIREDYSLFKLDGKFKSEMTELINIIMADYCRNYLRKEKVKKIQYNLKNSKLKGSGRPGRKVDK